MNRRRFLHSLGIGAAAVVAGPAILGSIEPNRAARKAPSPGNDSADKIIRDMERLRTEKLQLMCAHVERARSSGVSIEETARALQIMTSRA